MGNHRRIGAFGSLRLFPRHFANVATLVRLDLPRQCFPSICLIKIRIETHDLKIQFHGGGVLVCIIEIKSVFPCGINDAAHIVRLQADKLNTAVNQDVLHEPRKTFRLLQVSTE